jgi:hypothetical protein
VDVGRARERQLIAAAERQAQGMRNDNLHRLRVWAAERAAMRERLARQSDT